MNGTSASKDAFSTPVSLAEYYRGLPSEVELWLGPEESISAADLKHLLDFHRNALAAYRNASVGLQFQNDLLLAKALVLLDGVCGRLLLLPGDISPKLVDDFIRASGIQIFLTDSSKLRDSLCFERAALWTGGSLPIPPSSHAKIPLPTQWILATSGTTAAPKLVIHSLETLTRSTLRNWDKGRSLRWALLYELSRFAGLQVFFQTVLSGTSLLFTSRLDSIEQRLASFVEKGGNAISATPSMWRKILMSDINHSMFLRQITLGGEIADQKILTALSTRFPNARVVHIYASTEAGVGFSVKDGRAGFPADWLENPPAGIALRVDTNGTLFLRSERQNQRYLAHDFPHLVEKDGFICTGDQVKKDGDRFYFLGRSSGTINVGGNKVHPEEVESVLYELSEVRQCRVTGKANPFTGQIVIAEIVPNVQEANKDALTQIIAEYCRQRIEVFKIPGIIRIVDQLQISKAGKVVRT